MQLTELPITPEAIPGAIPAWQAPVNADQLRQICRQVQAKGGRLLSLWGSDERDNAEGFALHVVVTTQPGLVWLSVALDKHEPAFPDLSDIFPAAGRRQRATYDLLGIKALGAEDDRKWLRHGAWLDGQFPLRKDADGRQAYGQEHDNYSFVKVVGEGVHEIPVGPVHAGTIEPGHFRFQIVGEKILRLEERLGYKHKGIEKLFERMDLQQGARLAGRISGDSTVAYAWAFAQAVEGASRTAPPARALWLRALFLERERVANHLGDLGALGNDAGLAFGLAQFSRLKEDVLRNNQALFGHRYLMDTIIPGGVARDLAPTDNDRLISEMRVLTAEIKHLQDVYYEHAGLQDRFITTGQIAPELAARLGLIGLAGRASGQAWDNRAQYPCEPYMQLDVRMMTHRNGDVAARVIVRFEELYESLRLCQEILAKLPMGEIFTRLNTVPAGSRGLGWVEGWRGEVLLAVQTGADARIRRAFAHDPSWQNWPVLEYAVMGNIVPDFPLINKSFNLSYSGHDL